MCEIEGWGISLHIYAKLSPTADYMYGKGSFMVEILIPIHQWAQNRRIFRYFWLKYSLVECYMKESETS